MKLCTFSRQQNEHLVPIILFTELSSKINYNCNFQFFYLYNLSSRVTPSWDGNV